MNELRPAAAIDRFQPALEQIRKDMDAAARAGAPGCTLVVVTAIAGAMALVYAFEWNPGWETDPAVLASLAGYVAAVWGVWKLGSRWAAPAAAVAARASQRLGIDVLQPLIADIRPGARYVAAATAPPGTLDRSRLTIDWPFKSANQICWRAGGLDMEIFDIECVETSDSPGRDRYFLGLLARASLPELDDDLHVVVRSRVEFSGSVPIRGEHGALDGFAVDGEYRVISNFAPFAHAVCTPRLQQDLQRVAAEGRCVHVAIANRAVWVGIEVDTDSWFRRYPLWTSTLLRDLDNAHASDLQRQIEIVESLASEAARAARAYVPPSEPR